MAYYRKDQLSIKTRKLLADYLADLIIITESIQSFRIALAQTPYFNGVQLFRYLDKKQKGYLIPSDFGALVKDEGKKILHYAFSWFDVSKVGEITKSQFLQFLYPRRNPQLRQLITDRMIKQVDQQVKQSSIYAQVQLFQALIVQIMQRQIKTIPKRRMIMYQQDYTLKAVMNCLDVESRGWITVADLYKFLKNFDIDVLPGNVCQMLGVYDKDINGKITMKELQILVQGLENSEGFYRKVVRNSDRKSNQTLKKSRCTCNKSNRYESVEKNKNNTYNKQNKSLTSTKKNQKSQGYAKIMKNKQQLFSQRKKQNSNKKQTKKQKPATEIKKSTKNQKSAKTKIDQFRHEFEILQKKSELIDKQLIIASQQMGIKTQMQMQQQLQNIFIKRNLILQQQERIRKQERALEIRRQEEELLRIQQINTARRIQMQYRVQAQRQLQDRLAMEEKIRRQQQNLRRSYQFQRQLQRRRQAEVESQLLKNRLHQQRIQQQLYYQRKSVEAQTRAAKTQLDWNAQLRLRNLHQKQTRQRLSLQGMSLKQSQYVWRYNNYCQKLACIGDPLGIKQHIIQTDKYLLKSKQIRDEIKRDRTSSLNRYSYGKSSRKKDKIITQNDQSQKTPLPRKDLMQNIQKRTQQTKLVWS